MKKMAILVTLLLSAVSCCCVCAQTSDDKAGDSAQVLQGGTGTQVLQGGVGTHFLQGGIQHSEQLAPVKSGLKVGAAFDEAKLEKLAPARIWFRVPPWMAGKWQYDGETQTFYQNYEEGHTYSEVRTFSRHNSESWGFQRDRLGGFWDCVMVPALTQVESDKELWKDLHTDDSVIFDSDAKVIMRYKFTRTFVNKITNTIRSVKQVEQFTSFFPYGPDKLRAEFSIKIFDDRGNPISLTKTWKIGNRIAPTKLSNYDRNNEDVRASFREYLISHGMENLVPGQE